MGELDAGESDQTGVELAEQRVDHVVVVVEIVGLQRIPERVEGDLDLPGAQVGNRRHLLDRDLVFRQPLDVGEQTLLTRLGKRDRHTRATGAPNPTDAVDVCLRGRGNVVVEHVGQLVDVEAAGGDVGGKQQVGMTGAQPVHHLVALFLTHAAVQCLGAIAAAVHRLGQLIDLAAGTAEHDRRRRGLDVEDAAQGSRLM